MIRGIKSQSKSTLNEHYIQSMQKCIYCQEPASRRGEHVLPRWLLKRWLGTGPFTAEVNGASVTNHDLMPKKIEHFSPFLIPVCDGSSPNNCNGTLNKIYEVGGKPAVRTVLESGNLESGQLVSDFARWWIKTMLLLQHPECRNEHFPGLQPRFALPASVYSNLIEGVVSPDISIWVAIFDKLHGRGQLPSELRLYLPTTSDPNGGGGRPVTLLIGLALKDARLLLIQFAMHPLSDFSHPCETAGLCARLRPDPPHRIDITAIPSLNPEGLSQFGSLLVDARLGENFPTGQLRARVQAVMDESPLNISPW
jgi:hypothetical protein